MKLLITLSILLTASVTALHGAAIPLPQQSQRDLGLSVAPEPRPASVISKENDERGNPLPAAAATTTTEQQPAPALDINSELLLIPLETLIPCERRTTEISSEETKSSAQQEHQQLQSAPSHYTPITAITAGHNSFVVPRYTIPQNQKEAAEIINLALKHIPHTLTNHQRAWASALDGINRFDQIARDSSAPMIRLVLKSSYLFSKPAFDRLNCKQIDFKNFDNHMQAAITYRLSYLCFAGVHGYFKPEPRLGFNLLSTCDTRHLTPQETINRRLLLFDCIERDYTKHTPQQIFKFLSTVSLTELDKKEQNQVHMWLAKMYLNGEGTPKINYATTLEHIDATYIDYLSESQITDIVNTIAKIVDNNFNQDTSLLNKTLFTLQRLNEASSSKEVDAYLCYIAGLIYIHQLNNNKDSQKAQELFTYALQHGTENIRTLVLARLSCTLKQPQAQSAGKEEKGQ